MLNSLATFTKNNSVPLYVLTIVGIGLAIAANLNNHTTKAVPLTAKPRKLPNSTTHDTPLLQPAAASAKPLLQWRPLPPQNKVLTKIAFGSCLHQNKPQPIWQSIVADRRELKSAYTELADRPEFELARDAFPILATWDDHDYGGNDAGADFKHKEAARALFMKFLNGSGSTSTTAPDGIYYAKLFGPEGRRIQILMLDTRSFRSDLLKTPTQQPGKGRYQPDPSPGKTLLGAQQWAWLEQELRKPAALRIIASSIQVLADGHGWERWGNLPAERQRLFDLIKKNKSQWCCLPVWRQAPGRNLPQSARHALSVL